LVPRVGLEPTTCGIEAHCSNPLSYRGASTMVRVAGIEPASQVWKTCILAAVLHSHILIIRVGLPMATRSHRARNKFLRAAPWRPKPRLKFGKLAY
jgi:hypothetical protein